MKEDISEQKTALEDAIPWLSVIVPIYNSEKYLKRCVNSILRQIFRDFELLLIDDGSTDRTPEICKSYTEMDKRVRYFRKENGGCYQSRLYGAERMRGQYFMFCDSDDDYRTPQAFQIIFDKIAQYNPQVLEFRCQTTYRFWRKPIKNTVLCDTVYNQKQFREQQYPKLLFQNWPGANLNYNVRSKVYKRCLAGKLPSADAGTPLFRGEDIAINLCLLENVESALFIPDVLYSYRQPPNRGTRIFSRKEMEDLDKVTELRLHVLERWEGAPQARNALEEKIYKGIAMQLFRYAVNGTHAQPEEELENCLREALELPRFRRARQYYSVHTENEWWLLELFRNADPKAYIACAKAEEREQRIKKALWRLRRRILTG